MNPWMSFEQARCFLENQCNCEFIYDALIRQPSAFWSSLAYLMAAGLLYRQVREKSFDIRLWTALIVLLGVSSHLAHGTFIRASLAMDLASIVVVISAHALLNLLRTLRFNELQISGVFLGYFLCMYGVMYSLPKWWKVGIYVGIFLFALADLVRELRWGFLRARQLQYAVGVLAVSFALFMMDELKIYCEPKSLFQLHSLWHFGTAFALYLYGRWRFQARPAVLPVDYRSDTEA